MWKAVRFFLGSCRVRISGASPEMALERLSRERILVQEICRVDDFCVEVRILRRDAARAAVSCARAMCAMDVLETAGFGQVFRGLRSRWIFAALLAVCIAAGYVIPKFVFFYRVSGNDRVPAERILRELQELGVGFGTYGPRIKPQELKNRIFENADQICLGLGSVISLLNPQAIILHGSYAAAEPLVAHYRRERLRYLTPVPCDVKFSK